MSILVVEDEPFIAMYVEDCLIEAGFRVQTVSNADKAIALLERDPSIRIVITDIDMPGSMDGLALAQAVRNSLAAGVADRRQRQIPARG